MRNRFKLIGIAATVGGLLLGNAMAENSSSAETSPSTNSCVRFLLPVKILPIVHDSAAGRANTVKAAISVLNRLESIARKKKLVVYTADRLNLVRLVEKQLDTIDFQLRKQWFVNKGPYVKSWHPGKEQHYSQLDQLGKSLIPADLQKFDRNFAYDELTSLRYKIYLQPIQRLFSALNVIATLPFLEQPSLASLDVLDLGAGIGDTTAAILSFYPKARITALDQSPWMLEKLNQEFPNVAQVIHDFREIPLPIKAASKDLVFSYTAAGLYLDPVEFEALARDIFRILKPGGLFSMEFSKGYTNAVQSGEDISALHSALERAGFEIEYDAAYKIQYGTNFYDSVLVRKPRTHRGNY